MRVRFFLDGKEISTRDLTSPPAVGDEVFTVECPCRVERRKWLVLENEERNREVEIHLVEIVTATPKKIDEFGMPANA